MLSSQLLDVGSLCPTDGSKGGPEPQQGWPVCGGHIGEGHLRPVGDDPEVDGVCRLCIERSLAAGAGRAWCSIAIRNGARPVTAAAHGQECAGQDHPTDDGTD